MSYYVGIDLGGTNIKAGVVDQEGKLFKQAVNQNKCSALNGRDYP